jgi:crotonobetainyl-CoA:carnitine CoA-transferase CaiB-like acyl-CoA transferase
MIEAWMAGFPDDAAVLAALEAARVPSGPVLSPTEALNHPYYRERGTVRTTRDPILGELAIPGFPLRFSAQPELPDLQAPLLGEHNATVLERVLGYDAARIGQLRDAGVLVTGTT